MLNYKFNIIIAICKSSGFLFLWDWGSNLLLPHLKAIYHFHHFLWIIEWASLLGRYYYNLTVLITKRFHYYSFIDSNSWAYEGWPIYNRCFSASSAKSFTSSKFPTSLLISTSWIDLFIIIFFVNIIHWFLLIVKWIWLYQHCDLLRAAHLCFTSKLVVAFPCLFIKAYP